MNSDKKQFSSLQKPKHLYHASQNSNIDVLEPHAESVRNFNEGPVVFATPNLPYATTFLVKSDDSWAVKGRFNNTFYVIISDKNRFFELDKGGTIYTLPNDTFYCDPEEGMGINEWISKKAVRPIRKQHYKSGIDAMIDAGVQVYFVDKQTFLKIREAGDHGFSILQSLQSENQKLNKNVLSFGGMEKT